MATSGGKPHLRHLGDGVYIPILGLGTWRLSGKQGYEAVRLALDTGYRHFDTATRYGNEAEIGRAIRDSGIDRQDIFLTTKLPEEHAGHERRTLTESLRALDTDYVDLWLIHWPPGGQASLEVWREFISARDADLARAIGVSNYSPQQLDELTGSSGVTPAINQIPWSPSRHSVELLEAHAERGIVLEGYSPFKYTNLEDPVLREIANIHQVSPAQVVLRWHLAHNIVAIPKSGNPERIASNFDLFTFSLTDEETNRIDTHFAR